MTSTVVLRSILRSNAVAELLLHVEPLIEKFGGVNIWFGS